MRCVFNIRTIFYLNAIGPACQDLNLARRGLFYACKTKIPASADAETGRIVRRRENAPPGAGWLLAGGLEGLHALVGFDSCRGEAVVLPPGGQGGGHRQAGGHQALQLGVLNGQDRLAGRRQDLVSQGQRQAGGAGNGTDGNVHGVLLSFKSSFFAAGTHRQAFAFVDNVGDGRVPVPQGYVGIVTAAQGFQAIGRDGALVNVVEAQVQDLGPQQALDAVFQGFALLSFPAEVADGVAHRGAENGAHSGHHHAGQHAGQRGQENLFHWHHLFSGPVVEAALVRSDIHMDKGIVDAQAAVLSQQLVRVGVDLGGGVALHLDVRRQPVAVLAFGAAVFDLGVVGYGAVAAVDVQRPPEMHPDILQDVDQGLADEHRPGAVPAGYLMHLDMS